MTEKRYKREDWAELTEKVFKYNSLLVKKAVYENLHKKPKDYGEFKAKVLEFINWYAGAVLSRLPEKQGSLFKESIDHAVKESKSDLEKIIQKTYEQLI